MKRLLILPPWIWLRRFRQRCGYGVHSPFAFDFITYVLYEKGAYYAYRQLDGLLPKHVRQFRLRPRKLLRLFFRLANYSEAKKALFLGDSPLALAYMKAAVPSAEWKTKFDGHSDAMKMASLANGKEMAQDSFDLMFLGECAEQSLSYSFGDGVGEPFDTSLLPTSKLIIIDDLRHRSALFDALKKDDRTTLTFDLYDVGIVMQGLSLNRQDYVINF